MSKRSIASVSENTSPLRTNNIPDHVELRFEDYMKERENKIKLMEKKKTEKKTTQDGIYFDTFTQIDTKDIELKLFNHQLVAADLEPEFDLNLGVYPENYRQSRIEKISFEDLVKFVFDNRTLDAWIEYNVRQEKDNLPKVLYGPNQGEILSIFIFSFLLLAYSLGMKRILVLKFFIVKLYIIGKGGKNLNEYFAKGRRIQCGSEKFSMSEVQFQKLHQYFHLPIQLYYLFTDKFSSLVLL
jgi:hypothetical protein